MIKNAIIVLVTSMLVVSLLSINSLHDSIDILLDNSDKQQQMISKYREEYQSLKKENYRLKAKLEEEKNK